jgi:SAM-dependent methyltransferase
MPADDRKPSSDAQSQTVVLRDNPCWCGASELRPFSETYAQCGACHTLVTRHPFPHDLPFVEDDARDFYGKDYWFSHQEGDLGQPGILKRTRTDLPERGVHWLRAVLKYKRPPGRILELGSAHGGFVALLRWAGFDAAGLELSPWVVSFARQTFDVPVHQGALEQQDFDTGSFDAIALMDVLEHLPDPVATIGRALAFLKPDGVLVIQTPRYPRGTTHAQMVESGDRFLEQLKTNEHLFLFSDESIELLLSRLGAAHVRREPAIFSHYDMFVVAGRAALSPHSAEAVSESLGRTPSGRMIQALLDLADQRDAARRSSAAVGPLRADVAYLKEQIAVSEADRARRLAVIEQQGSRMQQAEEILRHARQGWVLRLAHAVRPGGAALAIERAADLLQGGSGSNRTRTTEVPPGAAGETPFVQGPAALAQERAIALIRDPKTTEPFNYTPTMVKTILADLAAVGFSVEEITVAPADYHAYFNRAGYAERYPDYYSFNLPEKSLEHFVAARLLELGPADVYIDIASEHSPVPEIYTRLFGCVSYRQDLAYSEGLHGDRIGGDAAAMAVPDGFATKMALHCSFEHFEGDADMRFVREVRRVLRAGGRVCFAPLYLSDQYGVLTDPAVAVAEKVSFDPDALVYCRPGWGNRHGRLYDAAHLESRIRRNLAGMQLRLYRVVNAAEIDPGCYLQFAAVIARP